MQFALDNLRMVDFTRAQAGPLCTALLADMGMEVIKVESAKRHDFQRSLPPHPPGDDGYNSPYFAVWHRGKKSCTLDVSQPEGLELVKRLIKVSDVVIDNFAPGVMDKLGLGYAELVKVKPDIVVAALSGFGATGPYKSYVAFAKPIQAFMGLLDRTGYIGGPPMEPAAALGDNVGGTYTALAILAALYHRDQTGEGQFIDASMTEGMICSTPEGVLEYAMNQTLRPRLGNRDSVMVPHNTYRCQGEDEWVAIAVSSDDEWDALRQVIGKPELDRWGDEDGLDSTIEEWTINRTKYEAMEILQQAGVAAAAVLNTKDMLNDPHLKERNFFVEVDHPQTGKWPLCGPSWRMSGTPGGIRGPAPSEGTDNEYVFKKILGLSDDDIAELVRERVIE